MVETLVELTFALVSLQVSYICTYQPCLSPVYHVRGQGRPRGRYLDISQLEHRAIIIAGQANPPTKTREDIRRNRFAQLYGQQRPALVSGAALFASDGPYSDAAVFHIVLKQKTGPGAHEGDPPSLLRCTPSFL